MDYSRTGYNETIEFQSEKFKPAWIFQLREHTWEYKLGLTVWALQAVSGRIGDRDMIFTGSYEKSVYAIDPATGRQYWRFITGAEVNAAPGLGKIAGRDFLFVASNDRSVYTLDAATGERIWSYEIYPWSFTVSDAVVSSPLLAELGGENYLYVGYWFNDRKSFRTVQRGALLCLDPVSGKKKWEKHLGPSPVGAPTLVVRPHGSFLLVTVRDGKLLCLDAETGEAVWRISLSGHIYGAASVVGNRCFVGDSYGLVSCINIEDGVIVWRRKLGEIVCSTIAHYDDLVFVGSVNRNFYALDMETGAPIWKYTTGKHIVSSGVICKINGVACVAFTSMDGRLYVCNARTGAEIWSFQSGPSLWSHERKGIAVHPSPSFVKTNARNLLLFPALDGKLYAFYAEETAQ
ncbi:MAG: PQQ-binding-like beta-propeller repeat protein [Candidatus Izemoplasmatales bacterium]|nr:PQQ-binding-like beta-propeller repeat protein [Candidatus Izemoplasmatales bacterium]